VVIVDNELRVVFANEALLRLGNFKREEIEGMRPDAIFSAKERSAREKLLLKNCGQLLKFRFGEISSRLLARKRAIGSWIVTG